MVKSLNGFLSAIKRTGSLKNFIIKLIFIIYNEGPIGIINSLIKLNRNNYTKWINRYDTLSEQGLSIMKQKQSLFETKPLISVIMPVFNPNPIWLTEALDSVINQVYQNWELCIADDNSKDNQIKEILEQYKKKDSRIKVAYRDFTGHIAACSNSALTISTGEWITMLDHDDILPKQSFFWIVQAINAYPQAKLLYSDEDKIDNNRNRSQPYFKCDWNQELFYSQNFINHLVVYDSEIVKLIGGFRTGLEGSQDHDLALRFIEKIRKEQIVHVPRILYHWRIHPQSTSQSLRAKSYAQDSGVRAINEHFNRCGMESYVEANDVGWYRLKHKIPEPHPLVSILIPTKNALHLIKTCITSILARTSYDNFEIVIIDNDSTDRKVLEYFQSIQADQRIHILSYKKPFNFSALNNDAVKCAKGEFILLLNNDIEVITHNWIEEMLGLASLPDVGAVGAKLYYPDNKIQHAGVILGIGGVAGHGHKYLSRKNYGYFGRAILPQEVSAVTAACLLVKKDIYLQVGGLNGTDLTIAFNDVDFCLTIKEAGYRNIWTPYAELFHHESASRGVENTKEKSQRFNHEVKYMKNKWAYLLLDDPAYNPNLTLKFEDYSLAWPPRIR